MHKRKNPGPEWELPGGRMMFGETIEEALVREMREETGLSVSPVSLLATWNYINNRQTRQVAGVIYLVSVTATQPISLSDEHDGYTWLPLEDLDKLFAHFAEPLKSCDLSQLTRA